MNHDPNVIPSVVNALRQGIRSISRDPWKLARAVWNPSDAIPKQIGASLPVWNSIGESHKDQSIQQLLAPPQGPFGVPMPLGIFP